MLALLRAARVFRLRCAQERERSPEPFARAAARAWTRVRREGVKKGVKEDAVERRVARSMTYREKLLQADREAKTAVVGLVLTIVVWLVCGIGLSGLDVKVFGTPLWILGGTLGTWTFSIVVAVVLGKRVFVDFDLDDDAPSSAQAHQDGGTQAPAAHHAAGIARRDASTAYQAASVASHAAGVQTSAAHQAAGVQASAAPAGKDGGFRG